jgi:tetratricopeptide (TPR) repeat protein
MLGSVDIHDYQLVERDGEAAHPRKNLNRAMRAFEHTIQHSPDFKLGYAHLVNMHSRVARSVAGGLRVGFEPPGTVPSPIWEEPEIAYVEALLFLHPVLLDSVVWVDSATFVGLDSSQIAQAPDRLLRRAESHIRRWTRFAPESPQPHQELAKLLLARRRHVSGDWVAADSLAREALTATTKALAAKSDTTPEDLIRLGAVLLSAGELDSAVAITEAGLEEYEIRRAGERGPPQLAINVLLAAGKLSKAVEITRAAMSQETWHNQPPGGRLLRLWIEPEIGELRAYGATGFAGPALRSAFDRVEQVWTRQRYTEAEKRFLRQSQAMSLATALALDVETLRRWINGWSDVPECLAALAVLDSGRTEARSRLETRLAEIKVEELRLTCAFLLGTVAQELGKHETALRMFDRVRGAILDAETHTQAVSWGLQSRSLLLSARSHQTLGQRASAADMYSRFVGVWKSADSVFEPLLAEAREIVPDKH